MLRMFTFFAIKGRYKKHRKCCIKMPGILYKFENQNLVMYGYNLKFRGDLPFAAYFDFETTTTPYKGYKSYDSQMYPIPYCLIFVLYRKQNIDRIVVLRRFSYTLAQLNDVSYLTAKMLENVDMITAEQLKDCAQLMLAREMKNIQFRKCFLQN